MKPSLSTRNQILDIHDSYDQLSDKIAEIRANGEIVLLGDLNARTGTLRDFFDHSILENNYFSPDFFTNDSLISENDLIMNNIRVERKNEDVKINDFGYKLIKLCQVSGMIICNGRTEGDKFGSFTYVDRKGKSSIDYAIISKGLLNLEYNFHVHLPSIFSDHNAITLKFQEILLKDNECLLNSIPQNDLKENSSSVFYKLSHDNLSTFKNHFDDVSIVESLEAIIRTLKYTDDQNAENIDLCINSIYNILETAAEPLTISKENKNNNYKNNSKLNIHQSQNHWYDNECKTMKKEFDSSVLIYKETLQKDDLENLCTKRNRYRKLCRSKRANYKSKISLELVSLSKKNAKLFWKKIKDKKKKQVNNSCDFDVYFKNLYENNVSDVSDCVKNKLHDFKTNVSENIVDFLDNDITIDELNFAISKLNNNKSPGSDKIVNEFLKNNSLLFRKALISIFNSILHAGYFPSAWTLGLIIPIHKKGDINLPENYRGITLLSCLSKLFTNIINIRLNKWSEFTLKFDDFQFGFRAEKSTIDAMFILQTIVEIFLSQKKALYVSFIDLRKAFDKTHHEALWFKLHQNGISSKLIK